MQLFSNGKKGNKKPKKTDRLANLLSQALFILLVIALLYSVIAPGSNKVLEVPISEVAQDISNDKVQSIIVKGDKLTVTLKDGVLKKTKKEQESSLSETLSNYGVPPEKIAASNIDIKSESGFIFWLMNILPILIPIAFIVLFFFFMSGQMKGGGGMKAFSFGQSKARIQNPDAKKVTFKSVAGNEEAKQELVEVVDFLKNPKKYLDIGAKIPKGILLTGSPGTGKTLLARAVAGEANVPFFHLSGSEFVEMFVGVGASRVRDLFDNAKKVSPAIIFIDEIDAVGRSRGVGVGGGNDEREQTLNQILVEMDGFEPTEKVIVMAATNRADVLDPALLRPGRFDRRVYLGLPDRKDREAILNIHANEKPLEENVNLKLVAERTPGFSGADLESLMNEAAILAARFDRKTVSQADVLASIEKVMMGPERKSHLHTKKEREIVAYHEAGHAIVASALPDADAVHKITIIPRGSAAGYTMKLPTEDRKLTSKREFLDDLAMSFGGRAAEKIIFGDITTGAYGDIESATRIARNMVMKYGMSDELGPIAFGNSEGRVVFGEGVEGRDHSEETDRRIDAEVADIIKNAQKVAEDTLTKYRNALEAVAKKLLEVETLEQDEYNALIKPFGLTPKPKEA